MEAISFSPEMPSRRRHLPPYLFQPMVADAERLQVLERAEHIILVPARLANGAANNRRGMAGVEPAGILLMRAVESRSGR